MYAINLDTSLYQNVNEVFIVGVDDVDDIPFTGSWAL